MIIEVKVPSPGESISEVELASWLVEDGQQVEKDQDIAEIDSDKATINIAAEESGKIKLIASEGDTIEVGSVIATIDTGAVGIISSKKETKQVVSDSDKNKNSVLSKSSDENIASVENNKVDEKANKSSDNNKINQKEKSFDLPASPLARKMIEKENISEKELLDFFKSYRFKKEDVQYFIDNKNDLGSGSDDTLKQKATIAENSWKGSRETRNVKLSSLRKKLAQRLVSVKNETAMLTTFNEVNMSAIMEIRKKYKEQFKEKYGVNLGFMSFFTKAVTEAIALFPQVNAQINENEIVYFDYVDVGIAVSAPKGLVVPVLRNAEMMSLDQIERKIKELAIKARDNKITLDEMTGGTFTITNGGVFGSMMSTPILNPPQSAILGMHNIVERPIAIKGKVEIHPMMYLALSYDHRIIDGRESVSFLVKVKEMLEKPEKMLFGTSDPVEKLLGF